jgi:dipeptide transport system substrate-binding protein
MKSVSPTQSKIVVQILRFTILLCFLSYIAPALAAPDSEAGLTYCARRLPPSLDPLHADSAEFRTIIRPLFDRLVESDPRTGVITPGLATHWDVASDGLTVSFDLRSDVRFQSTQYFQPSAFLAASDVAQSLRRAVTAGREEAAVSTNVTALSTVVKDIREDGPTKVVISLKRPTLDLLPILASPELSIISAEFMHKPNGPYRFPDFAIGTGPLKVISRDEARIEFLRNDDYWNAGAVAAPMIVAIPLSDDPTIAAIQAGELCDVVAYLHGDADGKLVSSGSFKKTLIPTDRVNFLAFRPRNDPVVDKAADRRVRRAIGLGISRDNLLAQLAPDAAPVSGFDLLATSSRAKPHWDFSPKQAGLLLTEAGISPGMSLYVAYDPHDTDRSFVDAVSDGLKSIGISAKPRPTDKIYLVKNWSGDEQSASAVLFSSAAGPNLYSTFTDAGFCDWINCGEPVQEKLTKLKYTEDPNRRTTYEKEALDLIVSEGNLFPLMQEPAIVATRVRVKALPVDDAGVIDLAASKINASESTAHAASSTEALYRATLSPLRNTSPLTLFDGRSTTVEFSIAPASAPNDIPQGQRIAPHLPPGDGGQIRITVELACSFCDADRVQRRDIVYLHEQAQSTTAFFQIVPLASAAGTDGRGELLFTMSSSGIDYDQVRVTAFVTRDVAQSPAPPSRSFDLLGTKQGAASVAPDVVIALTQSNNALGIELEIYDSELIARLKSQGKVAGTFKAGDVLRFRTGATSLDSIRAAMHGDYLTMKRFTNPEQWKKMVKAAVVSADEPIEHGGARLSEAVRDKILGVLVGTGTALYYDLFHGTKPPITDIIESIESYGRERVAAKGPLRVLFKSFGYFLPWQLLNRSGPNPDLYGFWGLLFQMTVAPVDVRRAFGEKVIPRGIIFGHYKDTADEDVTLLGEEQAAHLIQFRKDAAVSENREKFLSDLSTMRKSAAFVATFTHGRLLSTDNISSYGQRLDFSQMSYIFPNSLRQLTSSLPSDESFFSTAPTVLLNGCETAATAPHNEYGNTFVGWLLRLGAGGVIATQGEIPEYFGRHFGEHLMDAILSGEDVSRALWRQRRYFLETLKNPFGLLYSYYGLDFANRGT